MEIDAFKIISLHKKYMNTTGEFYHERLFTTDVQGLQNQR